MFLNLHNAANIPIFIFFHFYLALIGIYSCFFIGILIRPCWFSIDMKFCKIISELFILIFQFANGCMPWMCLISEVHTLENKVSYHWKTNLYKGCIFSVCLDTCDGKALSYEPCDTVLLCSSECFFPSLCFLTTRMKGMHTIVPISIQKMFTVLYNKLAGFKASLCVFIRYNC